MKGWVKDLDQVIEKLNLWLSDEMEISDEMAHEVAQAETIDEMVKAKNVYEVQNARTDAIFEAIRMVEEQK